MIQILPKKIERLRKKKFNQVKHPYNSYLKAKWNFLDIFKEIEELKKKSGKSFFIQVSKKYNITVVTLKTHYYKWITDGRPNDYIQFKIENRGTRTRCFTLQQDKELYDYIKKTFIDEHFPLSDEDIKLIALYKWAELDNKTLSFVASNGWCTDFKKRWNLSSVRPSYSREATKKYSEKEISEFITKCNDLCKKVGRENFFNMDETFWRMINFVFTTIGIKGSDSTKILYNGNAKNGLSVALIISAAGNLLKPIIIGKGKTKRCLEKLNLTKSVIGCFSNNGWMNNGIMNIVFDSINISNEGKPSVLLLDQYPSHNNEYIIKEAAAKNITLLYVPVGLTYKYQPLDVKINGILKSTARRLWRQERITDLLKIPKPTEPTLSSAVMHLMTAIKIINKSMIINSFNCILNT